MIACSKKRLISAHDTKRKSKCVLCAWRKCFEKSNLISFKFWVLRKKSTELFFLLHNLTTIFLFFSTETFCTFAFSSFIFCFWTCTRPLLQIWIKLRYLLYEHSAFQIGILNWFGYAQCARRQRWPKKHFFPTWLFIHAGLSLCTLNILNIMSVNSLPNWDWHCQFGQYLLSAIRVPHRHHVQMYV